MKLKNFNKARKILIVLSLIGAGISIYLESSLLILLIVGLSMVILTFLKTQVKNPIADERLQDVSEKAAQTSFKILMPILGLTSLALFSVGPGPFYFLHSLGVILGYVTCVGIGVYLVSYFYFKRKYGG
jgi:uncharacterized membrane protein